MSRFVRQSSYRHVYGQSTKREHCYDNIKVSASAWDTNLAAVNPKYIAINYQASGGGAFLVCPLSHSGKLPDVYPLCRAHSAPVLDTAWSPFDDDLIASVGEDGKISLTKIDGGRLESALLPEHHEVGDIEPLLKLNGHGRKAGHVKWHPSADSVLASSSCDIKIWNVEKGVAAIELPGQPDFVTSMSFNWTGTLLATTCKKDKKLRVYDLRAGDVVQIADSHQGAKGSRVEWMGRLDRICTTGFSKISDRQVYIWDSGDISKGPVYNMDVDKSSGTLMPFWSDNDILFLAGKGDGNIRYFEYEADELHFLSEYRASEPQRGLCWIPRRALNTHECEIARAYKLTSTLVEPIPFIVPRKSDSFQSDIYPPAPSNTPALSAAQFFGGKTAEPILVDLENFQAVTSAPIKTSMYANPPSTTSNSVGYQPAALQTGQALDSMPDRMTRSPGTFPADLASTTGGGGGSGGGVAGPRPLPPSPAGTTSNSFRYGSTDSPVTAAPHSAVISGAATVSTSTSSQAVADLQKKNSLLKEEVAEKDQIIQNLEIQLQRLRMNQAKIRELTG